MRVTSRISDRTVIVGTLALFGVVTTGPLLAQAPRELWEYVSDEDITHFEVNALGDLLVSTSGRTVFIDGDSGDPLWETTSIRRCELEKTDYSDGVLFCRVDGEKQRWDSPRDSPIVALRTGDVIEFVDMSSGETLWDSGVIPFDVDDYQIDFERGTVQFHSAPSEGGSMIALADLGDGKVLWTTEIPFRRSSRLEPGWVDFQDRSFDQLLIWGADDKGESATVGAIDRLTGSLLWQSQDQDLVGRMLGMGLYDVFVYSDSIAIGMRSDIPGDAGPLWALNLRTGRVEWESTERLTREVLDSWAWDDGGLFIRVDEALWAFNLSDGSTRWTRSDYGRHSVDLRVTERGLLVTCGFGKCSGEKDVILVDPATGDDHFRMETRDPILLANILGDDLFLFAEQRAYRVNLGDGTVEQGTEFEFRDGEQPTGLRPIAGGFLLYSPQNIVGVRVDGSVLFQRHYRAPGASFWSKVGRSIAEATLNSVITRVAQGQAESRARQNARLSALSGGSGEGIGVAYAPLLDLTMTPRIEALEAAADETYFYTRDPDAAGREGFSLVRLLSDGTEGGRIWINERSPDFSFDAASRRVFLKSDRKRIVALGFNPG